MDAPRRRRLGRLLDRLVTPVLGFGGRLLRRPNDEFLSEASGRKRGGEDQLSPIEALEAGRRALAEEAYAEALIQFGLAIERQDDLVWAWHGRGDAFQLAGQAASALASYDKALDLEPENALALLGRGNAHEQLGHIEAAVEAWETALALDPGLEWARKGLERHGR